MTRVTETQIVQALILVAVLLVVWNGLVWAWRGLSRYMSVRSLARRLSRPVVSVRRRRGGYEVLVTGTFEGRRVRVSHQSQGGEYLTFAVRLENAVDGLSIYSTLGSSTAYLERQRRTGRMAALGQESLDAKFAIQGTPGEEAARLFRSGRLEATLDVLFGSLGAMRVTTESGWLVATRRLRRGRVGDSNESLRTIRALSRIAPLFSRRELQLQLQGRSFAYTDAAASGGAICPYCRDGLDVSDGAGDPLTRCEACRTVHHQECWGEAGGCTVMGCTAQARQRRCVARL